MRFQGFSEKDFAVFDVPGLEPRMEALKSQLRPKLETLGEQLSPYLSSLIGDELFPHVAKHARRTVNPPDDTWVAWAADKRGYKKHPHFQIGMWKTHVFVWFAVIYECISKDTLGKNLEEQLQEIKGAIPPHFVWSEDHMQPGATPHSEMSDQDFARIVHRLQHVKKAELLCGIHLDRNDPVLRDGDAFINKVEDTFEKLLPLYRLSF